MPNEQYLTRTIDWRGFFSSPNLKTAEALVKAGKCELIAHSSTFAVAKVYKKNYDSNRVDCSHAPTSYNDAWDMNKIRCTCERRVSSYYYYREPCAHKAAMLLMWEKEHGPWIFTESEEEHASRIEQEARQEKKEAREKQKELEGSMPALITDVLGDRDATKEIPFFDVREIFKKTTVSLYEINRARDIVEKDGVSAPAIQLDYDNNGSQRLTAACDVDDEVNVNHTEVKIIADKVESYYCSCQNKQVSRYYSYYANTLSPCEHVTAMLPVLEACLIKTNPGGISNYATDVFLRTYDTFMDWKEQEENAVTETKAKTVVIDPMLVHDGDEIILTYRIGKNRSKLFILRDIKSLLKAYDQNAVFNATKKMSIDFSVEDLTDESQKWLTNIRRKINDVDSINSRLQAKNPWGYVNTLSLRSREALAGSELDSFYSLVEGESVECKNKSDNSTSMVRVGHKSTKIVLSSTAIKNSIGAAIGLEVTGQFPVIIDGSVGSYVFTDKSLSRISEDEKRYLGPFAKVADHHGRICLKIGKNDLSEFYYRVLPNMMQNPCIVYDDQGGEAMGALLPPEGEYRFQLDLDKGEVTCRAIAAYDGHSYIIGRKSANDGYRDERQEGRIDAVLSEYFVLRSGLYRAPEDDDTVYRILTEAVPALSRYGEVVGDKNFRLNKLRPAMEVSIGVSVESDLMDITLLSKGIPPEELLKVFESYRLKKKYYKLDNGDFLSLENAESFKELDSLSNGLGFTLEELASGDLQLPLYRALYLDKMLEEHDALAADRSRTFRKLIKNFNTIKDSDYEVPESFEGVLRKYQVYGYKWLRTLYAASFGGILADEMGLGKTIQIISMIKALKDEGENRPSLIVCPASLVYNWQEEFSRFAPELTTRVIAGGIAERRSCFAELRMACDIASSADDREKNTVAHGDAAGEDKAAAHGDAAGEDNAAAHGDAAGDNSVVVSDDRTNTVRIGYDVYITSYDLLRRDAPQYKDLLFDTMVIDEAQYIKNLKAAQTKAVKTVKSARRFALTGTPIENKLSELWSIFDFLMPGFLYSYSEFQKQFETAITKNKDAEATSRLKQMVSPFILRRLKTDVLKDLPDKLEEVRYARFDDEQRKLYDGQVVRMKAMIRSENANREKIQILAELTRIRQICCDPSLVFEQYSGGSAKLEACLELIDSAIEGGHRMLVFSQFTSMLEILEASLREKGIRYFKITGETPKEKRPAMVHEFNEGDVPVFLISLRAGGTGLNLTGADVVIHYDPWWNLAVQNQATDRAHRIGQTNKVTVYKIISKDTIEENILNMQEAKKDLANAILSGEQTSLMSLSPDELLELLG